MKVFIIVFLHLVINLNGYVFSQTSDAAYSFVSDNKNNDQLNSSTLQNDLQPTSEASTHKSVQYQEGSTENYDSLTLGPLDRKHSESSTIWPSTQIPSSTIESLNSDYQLNSTEGEKRDRNVFIPTQTNPITEQSNNINNNPLITIDTSIISDVDQSEPVTSKSEDPVTRPSNQLKNDAVVYSLRNRVVTKANFPTEVTTYTTCAVPDPPTLTYNDYLIKWNVTQTDPTNCDFASINLSCTDLNTFTDFNITSDGFFLDIRNASYGFKEGIKYNCTARFISINNQTSEPSNALKVPPGSEIISIKNNNGLLTWNEPFENVSLTYNVSIFARTNHHVPDMCHSNMSYFNVTYSQTYTIPYLEPDFVYEVTISTISWKLPVTGYYNFTTNVSAPGIPTNVRVEKMNETLAQQSTYMLYWNMPCDANGDITGYHINLVDSENTGYLDRNVSEPADRNNYTLGILHPNLDFTLYLYSIGINDEGKGAAINFSTRASLPEAPILTIIDVGSMYFMLNWTTPEANGSLITDYTLIVDTIGPTYPQSINCTQPPPIDPVFLNGSVTTYTVTDLWASYAYNVTLTASTSAGSGEPGIIPVTTNTSEPEAPYDLLLKYNQIDENNTIPGNLTWMEPCKLNGVIDFYRIVIIEKYTEDPIDTEPTIQYANTTYQYFNLPLKPSHIYDVNVTVQLSDRTIGNWTTTHNTTPVGYPGTPELTVISDSRTLYMNWSPTGKTGPIQEYQLNVTQGTSLYDIPLECPIPISDNFVNVNGSTLSYNETNILPYTSYGISLVAVTSYGYGNVSSKMVNSLGDSPENVRNVNYYIDNFINETYDATVIIQFLSPCHMYGEFKAFMLDCIGVRDTNEDIHHAEMHNRSLNDINSLTFKPLPEYNYSCTITTNNTNSTNITQVQNFRSPAGVPIFSVDDIAIRNKLTETAEIVLKKKYFNMTQGNVQYIALILNEKNVTSQIQQWNTSMPWPGVPDGAKQITEVYWSPFNNSDEITFVIGNGTPSNNSALKGGTAYYLSIRVFTNDFFRDSSTIFFETEEISKLGTIIGIIIAVLIVALLGLVGFFVWKKKLYRKITHAYPRKSNTKPALSETAIPVKKFLNYFKNTESKPELLKQQFALLTEKSKDIQASNTSNFAALLENKRKNRYVNISPYDETRVKLLIDEDDEIGSDYINASFIKGYSGDIEYIATQGPLSTTCRDFWRMVLQENVTIIAMVSNFVEKNKQKCHKYFPENHENLVIGDNMEIRCAVELHFGTYVIRNLQIRKDCTQVTVTHMQFLEWPDFRVPLGTEHMLQFCYQLRERVKLEGGVVIVHCSAGVGRTGTLIAADMLLQTVNAGKRVDIFNTVLDLRKQRVMMVQTEEQYVYIHRLIAEHIDRPPTPDSMDGPEPLYENMDIIKKPNHDYKIMQEEESRF